MKRASLSTAARVRIFRAHNGVCHLCGTKIQVGQAWDVSHDVPLEIGGADDDTNRKPAHRSCHRDHTAKVDVPTIAKAKRREAKQLGVKRRRTITRWRRFDGSIVVAPRER